MTKSLSFLSLFAFLSFTITAQDWAPIQPSEKYYYQLDGENYISHSIFVDSIIYGEFYTTYHFNRVIVDCYTCLDSSGLSFDVYPETFREINQGSFLGEKVNIAEDTWEFEGSNSFVIKPLQPLNEEWDFNEEGVTASIFGIAEQEIMGAVDSVKSIGISTGQVIRLSKNHGLLEFPDFQNTEVYDLIGIEEADLGADIPTFEDIFTYQVGDVYQYLKTSQDYNNWGYNYVWESINCVKTTKLVVLESELNEDGVFATFQRTIRDSCHNLLTDAIDLSWNQDTVDFYYSKADYMTLKHQPNQFNEAGVHIFPGGCSNVFNQTEHSASTVHHNTGYDKMDDGTIIEYYGGYSYFGTELDEGILVMPEETNEYQDIPYATGNYDFAFEGASEDLWYIMAWGNGTSYSYSTFAFAEDIGICSFRTRTTNYDGNIYQTGYQCDFVLEAYDTFFGEIGEIMPDDILLGIEEQQAHTKPRINIYPNPSSDYISIDLQNESLDKIEILDMNGRLVKSILDRTDTIDVSSFEKGFYLIRIFSDDNLYLEKLIVR